MLVPKCDARLQLIEVFGGFLGKTQHTHTHTNVILVKSKFDFSKVGLAGVWVCIWPFVSPPIPGLPDLCLDPSSPPLHQLLLCHFLWLTCRCCEYCTNTPIGGVSTVLAASARQSQEITGQRFGRGGAARVRAEGKQT